MKPSAFVTIIIPNYNHERFIKQRIESVLNQTYQNFELYILDDCSTDNSMNIIGLYRNHPKVKDIIVNPTNSGSLFKQWVTGIELAEGDYIWIAESDDFASPNFLEHTVTELTSFETSGLIFTDSHIVDADGKQLGLMSETHELLNRFVALGRCSLTSIDISSYFINDLIISNASSVLFRTTVLQQLDLKLLEQLSNAGDLFAYISILISHDMRYTNLPLNYYRSHTENETKKNVSNGRLHRDRLHIITYFAPQLIDKDANAHFMLAIFLKRHFLVCSDFGWFTELNLLLNVFRKLDVINVNLFRDLKTYCRFKILLGKRIPYFYRAFMKRKLSSIINS